VKFKLFNLIASVEPGWREKRKALNFVRDNLPSARLFAELQSLLLFKVNEPYKAVRTLSEKLVGSNEPILRLIPVDTVTPPYPKDVADAAYELVEKRCKPSDTFAVKLEGHLFDPDTGRRLHKIDAVRTIAERIQLPVNLSNPSILVLVKVVKMSRSLYYAAIMVAPPCVIYSKARNTIPCQPTFD
jgi:tRNA acetyltransferase TAN1